MVRRRRSIVIPLLVVAIFSASMGYIFGYYTYNRSPRLTEIENNIDNTNNVNRENKSDSNTVDVATQKEIINNDTKIIFRTYYERCKESVDTESTINNNMIGLNEEGFNELVLNTMPQFDLYSFSKDEIVLLENKQDICPKHYLITEYNGYIIVYRFNEDGQRVIFQETRIPVSILPPVDQEKLKNGIIKNSEEEVTSLLEDYS